MQINFIYDDSVANAPSGFKTGLAAAAGYLGTLITNQMTINIAVGWGENNGVAIPSGVLATGGPAAGVGLSYKALTQDLSTAASSQADSSVVANLPAADPTNGGQFFVSTATEKAWGLVSPTAGGIDGTIGFSTTFPFSYDPNARAQPGQYDFIGVAVHEITHAMGRFAGLQYAPGWYSPMDLVRYESAGKIALTKGMASYFSIDGGQTSLLPFDAAPQGDAGDWAISVLNDPFGYTRTNTVGSLSSTDITMLDVLGYDIAGAPVPSVNYAVSNQTTGIDTVAAGSPYSGPVAGITQDIIMLTSDNVNITSYLPNSYIRTGSGTDAIDVSKANGNNVIDGSTGSNFLVGGAGFDTFFVDNRNPATDIWSTIVNFHSGDNATIWGVSREDFAFTWSNGMGAAGATGLTGVAATAGRPTANITLAGYTTADMGNRLTVTYGQTPDLPGLPGSLYMNIHAT
jgi:hypothetical protein